MINLLVRMHFTHKVWSNCQIMPGNIPNCTQFLTSLTFDNSSFMIFLQFFQLKIINLSRNFLNDIILCTVHIDNNSFIRFLLWNVTLISSIICFIISRLVLPFVYRFITIITILFPIVFIVNTSSIRATSASSTTGDWQFIGPGVIFLIWNDIGVIVIILIITLWNCLLNCYCCHCLLLFLLYWLLLITYFAI